MSDRPSLYYVIVRPDGTVDADKYGNVPRFRSRFQAERWLQPGDRVEPRRLNPGEVGPQTDGGY